MAKRANPTVVGAFVVGAVALFIAGALALGVGRWFKGDLHFVLSFREPVTGLIVGSPVEFRGVKVGEVADIRALYDDKTSAFYFPVNIVLQADRFERLGPGSRNVNTKEMATALIERGLRARLETQSFVTGQRRIALDFFPDKVAEYAGVGYTRGAIELPTVPSQTEDIANLLKQIPFEKLGKDLVQVVDGLKLLLGPGSDGSVRPLSDVLASVQGTFAGVERELQPLLKDGRTSLAALREALAQSRSAIVAAESSLKSLGNAANSVEQTSNDARATVAEAQAAFKQIGGALEQARVALSNLASMTGEDSAVVHDVTRAARELATAGRAVRSLAEELRARPDALLRGKVSEAKR
jgi:paraquat-inducible protein B